MAMDSNGPTGQATLRLLTKEEIDSRIDQMVAELADICEAGDFDPLHPRPISPAELIDRLAKFIVYN